MVERIRVFLIDTYVLYRDGIRAALSGEEDIEVIGEARGYEDAFSQLQELSPEVVVFAPRCFSENGLELVRQVKQQSPAVPVIVISTNEDEDELFMALRAGAAAFFTREISSKELSDAIRRTFHGEYVINESLLTRPRVASRLLGQFQDFSILGEDVVPLFSPLSHRETEILSYIAQGNSNKEIAHALGIKNQTVKNHITSIMRKLAANDRTHAVVLALRRGLIRVD